MIGDKSFLSFPFLFCEIMICQCRDRFHDCLNARVLLITGQAAQFAPKVIRNALIMCLRKVNAQSTLHPA